MIIFFILPLPLLLFFLKEINYLPQNLNHNLCNLMMSTLLFSRNFEFLGEWSIPCFRKIIHSSVYPQATKAPDGVQFTRDILTVAVKVVDVDVDVDKLVTVVVM